MSKGGSQTVTQNVDPQTQAYVQQLRRYALGATGMPQPGQQNVSAAYGSKFAGPPGAPFTPSLPPEIAQAQQGFQNYAQGGQLGLSALTGNAGAAQQFLNPYTSLMNPFFAQQRAQAVQAANDQATQYGAFGGDRSAIGASNAGAQADINQGLFQNQAFESAMQRALQAANLGYGAGAQAAFLPQQYYGGQLGLLNQGMGPYGTTQKTQTSSDPFSQLLGLGVTGLSLASGLGWAPFAAKAAGGLGSTFAPQNFPTPGVGYFG